MTSHTDIFLDSLAEFQVKGIEEKEKLTCHVVNPAGKKHETVTTPHGKDGVKVAFTPLEEGSHEIDLMYEGLKVPGFPQKVSVSRGSDPSRVKAMGKGLEQAIANEPNIFQIETKG